MLNERSCDTLVIGAGIVGISVAYYLKELKPSLDVVLIDQAGPMELTSACSGENYRNWWPHPVMTAFTDRSIDLMEEIARDTGNAINMTRRGYALASRSANLDDMLAELQAGYRGATDGEIRLHTGCNATYQPADSAQWQAAPAGVDVITDPALIQAAFPSFADDIRSVVHIRRAGSISGQQLGQHMLQTFRQAGGAFLRAEVVGLEAGDGFKANLSSRLPVLRAGRVVNAAGPFVNSVARMLGCELPVSNVLQQKIAFEDRERVIPRQMPFSIDLDAQFIDWTDEEKALLAADRGSAWLADGMPGSIHCRPEGGDDGTWLKLGWAFNQMASDPCREPMLFDNFPEVVLRGAARLNPALKAYYGRLPRNTHHYGGYYTMTEENWPLVGALDVEGVYVAGAMSGFGTMAACAAGELCAKTVLEPARKVVERYQ